ncbi:unnamed protein product, partial [Ceratitis capitata]
NNSDDVFLTMQQQQQQKQQQQYATRNYIDYHCTVFIIDGSTRLPRTFKFAHLKQQQQEQHQKDRKLAFCNIFCATGCQFKVE